MSKHPYLLSIIGIAFLWQLASILAGVHFLPSPLLTMQYIANNGKSLSAHALESLYRIFMANLIAVGLGGAIGIWIARVEWMDRILTPVLYTLYPIPKIAFLPILMLFLGLGNASKITLVFLILFFQVAISVRDSVKGIHPSYYIAIRSLGANRLQTYQHVVLPAMLPGLFTSLRITVGTSISVLFFAENYATRKGIGYFIMDSWLKLDYVAMFSGIVTISMMGILLFLLLDTAERRFCPETRR